MDDKTRTETLCVIYYHYNRKNDTTLWKQFILFQRRNINCDRIANAALQWGSGGVSITLSLLLRYLSSFESTDMGERRL